MKIELSRKHVVCLDGSTKDELLLNEPVTREFLDYLGNFGDVTIRENLKTPAYFFYSEGYLSMKGVLNDDYVEMRRQLQFVDKTEGLFELILSSYTEGSAGIPKVRDEIQKIAEEYKRN